jgi:hypothetical protein
VRSRDWMRCPDPGAMLRGVSAGIGLPDPPFFPGYQAIMVRRVRIFVLTAARPVLDRVNNLTCHRAAEVGWRLAEGTATDAGVESARQELQRTDEASIEAECIHRVTPPELCLLPNLVSVLRFVFTMPSEAGRVLLAPVPWFASDRPVPLLTSQEVHNCCWLLREIFGHRGAVFVGVGPPAWRDDWRTDTAVALARQMYDSGDFSGMPILADALEDAGCDNADILHHCRGTERRPRKGAGLASNFGQHVRGCWVADLLLAKE